MKSKDIMVSVCCLSYNHEKYIKKTIDSILMQNTNFNFEIIINDDSSTDETPSIIRQYEKLYPDKIFPIFHENNEYAQGNKIFFNLFNKARGKYIALCECDDYWSNPNKLQNQFNILEANSDCNFCTHLVEHVSEDGKKLSVIQPKFMESGIYTGKNLISKSMTPIQSIFHLSSYFIRGNVLMELSNSPPHYFLNAPVGDIFLQLYLFSKGNTFYINQPFSCYRRNSIGSWTNRNMYKKDLLVNNNISLINTYRLFSEETNNKYHDVVNKYIRYLLYQNLCIEMNYKKIKRSYLDLFLREKKVKQLRIILCSRNRFVRTLYESIKFRRIK